MGRIDLKRRLVTENPRQQPSLPNPSEKTPLRFSCETSIDRGPCQKEKFSSDLAKEEADLSTGWLDLVDDGPINARCLESGGKTLALAKEEAGKPLRDRNLQHRGTDRLTDVPKSCALDGDTNLLACHLQ